MRLRSLWGLVALLLGMILPCERVLADQTVPGGGDDASAAIARAASLEAANARIAELEGINEEKIRAAAEDLVHDIFPQVNVPGNPPPAPYQRDDGQGTGHQPAVPEPEERLSQLEQRVADREIDDAMRELNERLDRAGERYPNFDRFRVLGQLARAGDSPVNVEKLVEVSHNQRSREFDEYYTRRRAEESATTRGNQPPPMPTNPGGQPVAGDKITTKTASATLAQMLKEKLGWGRQ